MRFDELERASRRELGEFIGWYALAEVVLAIVIGLVVWLWQVVT